ncbi:NF038130 family PEP-CTERM protein [Anabaena sp. CCY 9910]|uniref:NF038130 family PEP-CTERM protein n=1 Tax=Anabaena sp. CCY 9910 TaxID=3103870 RepID=UPI0039E047A9
MTLTIKKLLVGATAAASMTAITTTPSFAGNLARPTDIQFTTNGVNNTDANKPNINTWTYGAAQSDNTGIGGVNRRVLNDFTNKGNTNKAIAALTDNDSATNVELFTDGEVVKDHVGFTANLGKNTLKVESVTKDDWADGTLATAWLKGFGNAYGGLMSRIPTTANSNLLQDFNNNFDSLVTALKTTGFNSAGDANIGDITLNQKTGELKVDLVGHLDVSGRYVDTRRTVNNRNNSNYLQSSPDRVRNSTGNAIFDAMLFNLAKTAFLTNTPFQISEIAKITFNDKVDYAFGFSAIDSGAIAGDRNKTNDKTSHTGIYSWSQTYAVVPEPSGLFGLFTVGSLIIASRSKLRKNP